MATDSQLDELLLRWEELRDEGRPVAAEELCRDCPDLIAPLRRRIRALESMDDALDTVPSQLAAAPTDPEATVARSQLGSNRTDVGLPGPPADELPSPPGYVFERELGRGGMGVVYLARQVALGRRVALKMVLSGAAARPVERARFQAEGEAVARLQHPNIVHIYEVGEWEGQPYYSMEFVEGGSLRDCTGARPQPARDAAGLVEALARAMHYAHERGVVHRDLKPANILLTFSREPEASPRASGSPRNGAVPQIMDFGLAKRLDSAGGPTVTGDILGTPSYMAPEQAAGKEVGPAADIWALGAILYELLTGRPPFQAATPWDTILQVVQEEPVTPRRLQRALPADLDTICLKCLQKDAHKRYASAGELADDLRRFLDGEPIKARPLGLLGRALKWARRRPAAAALLAVCLLAVVGFTVGGLSYNARLRQALDAAEESNEEARQRLVRLQVAQGTRLLDNGDWFRALLWFAEALRLDEGRPRREEMHRRRLAVTLRECPQVVRLWLHDGPVRQAFFSPDGRRVLTVSEDHTARLWSPDASEPVLPPMRHGGTVWHAAFRPDGKAIATASADGTARVWDAATGRPLTAPLKHRGEVVRVAFDRDGRLLLTASTAGSARLWDAATGQPAAPPLRHGAAVRWAVFSPDGKRVATASDDGTAHVWDAATGAALLKPLRHAGPVVQVSYDAEGKRLVTASDDGTAQVWDAATGEKLLRPLRHQRGVVRARFSPDGRHILTAGADDATSLWSAATGELLVPSMKHRSHVNSARFSPDGELILTASDDNTARVWSAHTGQPLTPMLRHNGSMNCAAFSPVLSAGSKRRLVTVGNDNAARLWEITLPARPALPRKQTAATPNGSQSPGRWTSPDGRLVVTAEAGPSARLRDAATGRPIGPPLPHGSTVIYAAFSPDGSRFITGSDDNMARIWDAGTGELLTPPLEHGGTIRYAAFIFDGRMVVTAASDRTARVWDARTGEVLTPPLASLAGLKQVTCSDDGCRLTLTGGDGASRSWNLCPDDRPVADLVAQAQLLAGGRIDPRRGFLPLETGQLQALRRQVGLKSAP